MRRGARGARRRHGDDRPARAEPSGEVVGGPVVEGVAQAAATRVAGQRPLALLDAAERGADDDREARGRHRANPALRGQLVGGRDQEPRGAALRHAAPRLDPRELLDLAAAAHAEVADREALDLRDARGAGDQRRPEGVEILADRRHDAARLDDNALGDRHGHVLRAAAGSTSGRRGSAPGPCRRAAWRGSGAPGGRTR